MEFVTHSHRYAAAIINSEPLLKQRYDEFIGVLREISEDELVADYQAQLCEHRNAHTNFKSLSTSINKLIAKKMEQVDGWSQQVFIFNDENNEIKNDEWRLDFACENALAVEVAFNHSGSIAWNLIKPCLASELNHVSKAFQTRVGIYVCATTDMKKAGNFDGASGSYEKVIRYLKPMMNQLPTPLVIIGLLPPKTFRIDKTTKNVIMLNQMDKLE
jgi:hypothetical protein